MFTLYKYTNLGWKFASAEKKWRRSLICIPLNFLWLQVYASFTSYQLTYLTISEHCACENFHCHIILIRTRTLKCLKPNKEYWKTLKMNTITLSSALQVLKDIKPFNNNIAILLYSPHVAAYLTFIRVLATMTTARINYPEIQRCCVICFYFGWTCIITPTDVQ